MESQASTSTLQAKHEAGVSRYASLAREMRRRVQEGTWVAGQPIPSESELARSFGVALGTLRQALALLVDEGLLQKAQGRGTFVSEGVSGASMMRFFRFRDASGEVPRSTIVSRRSAAATREQADAFGLHRPAKCLHLQRVRSLAGRPVLCEHIVLPLPAFEALAALPLKSWDDLLYPMFAMHCGVTVARALDELSFEPLAEQQAALLALQPGHPGIRVERRAFDFAGRCIELRSTWGDAHAFRFSAETR